LSSFAVGGGSAVVVALAVAVVFLLSSFAAGGGSAVVVAIAVAVVSCCHPSPQAEDLLLSLQLPLLLFFVVILRRRRRICCCRYQFSHPEKNKLQNRGKFSRLD
jgi:hypothetical protein